MIYSEARLREVHKFTQHVKRVASGRGMCRDIFEEIPEPKHKNMAVQIGTTWYDSVTVLEVVENLRLRVGWEAITPGETLLVHILQDNQIPL